MGDTIYVTTSQKNNSPLQTLFLKHQEQEHSYLSTYSENQFMQH